MLDKPKFKHCLDLHLSVAYIRFHQHLIREISSYQQTILYPGCIVLLSCVSLLNATFDKSSDLSDWSKSDVQCIYTSMIIQRRYLSEVLAGTHIFHDSKILGPRQSMNHCGIYNSLRCNEFLFPHWTKTCLCPPCYGSTMHRHCRIRFFQEVCRKWLQVNHFSILMDLTKLTNWPTSLFCV